MAQAFIGGRYDRLGGPPLQSFWGVCHGLEKVAQLEADLSFPRLCRHRRDPFRLSRGLLFVFVPLEPFRRRFFFGLPGVGPGCILPEPSASRCELRGTCIGMRGLSQLLNSEADSGSKWKAGSSFLPGVGTNRGEPLPSGECARPGLTSLARTAWLRCAR